MHACLVLGLTWLVLALTPDAPAASPHNGEEVAPSSVSDVAAWLGPRGPSGSAHPCGHPRQDSTYDGIIDLADFDEFVGCVTAITPPAEVPCLCFDEAFDSDVDLFDFARFQAVFGWIICQPANPSFESPGELGNVFAGWYQFGNIASSCKLVPHGFRSAKTAGSTDEPWQLAGVWQRLEANEGNTWSAAVHVANRSTNPLTGGSRAVVNIEWYGQDGFIDYESHAVADSSTPCDEPRQATFDVGPAPAGCESLHLVLGVLQDPDEPAADVYFDLVELFPSGFDADQWNDFPSGRSFDFGGHTWRVKGPGHFAPGPSLYGATDDHVWLDAEELHLTVKQLDGSLYSSEVAVQEPLGYGDYIVTTKGELDSWDPYVVLGLFLYQHPPCWEVGNTWWNPANEADIEYTRWGDPANDVGNFAIQPSEAPGHRLPFPVRACEGETRTHAIRWRPTHVEFNTWCGGADDEETGPVIRKWSYCGPNVPRPEQPRMHINFWRGGTPPVDWTDHEIIIHDLRFVPWSSP